jgi:V8-like Glu-specific endopeptidase
MFVRASFGLVGAVGMAACAAAVEPGLDSSAAEVRGGTAEPGFTAVGRLQLPSGSTRITCTATLIDPLHVVTAGHCFVTLGRDRGFQDGAFLVGWDASAPEMIVPIQAVMPALEYVAGNDEQDIAIARLAQSIDGVTPIPLSPPLPQGDNLGTFVGYGGRGDGQSGQRYSTAVSFHTMNDRVAETPSDGLCRGDSGGPVLIAADSTFELAATLSTGDTSGTDGCGGPNRLMRSDTRSGWVKDAEAMLANFANEERMHVAGSVELSDQSPLVGTVVVAPSAHRVSIWANGGRDLTIDLNAGSASCHDGGQSSYCAVEANPGDQVSFQISGGSRTFYQIFGGTGGNMQARSATRSGGCGAAGGGGASGGLMLLSLLALLALRARRRCTRQ